MRNYGATISEFGEADVLVFQPELPMPAKIGRAHV